MKIDKVSSSGEVKQFLESLLGSFLYAVGINLFVVPANLYTSGLLGICQVIRTLMENYLHLSFGNLDIAGIIYYMINVPILIFAMTKIGKNFLIKTLVTVIFMTIFLAVIPIVPVIEDTMASCLVGGLFTGVGVGLMLRAHASLGGIDVLGLLKIRRKKDFSVGKMNLFFECLSVWNVCIIV